MEPRNLNNETINLVEIAKTLKSNWILFLVSIICCVGLAFCYSKISKDKYVVVSNILISANESTSGNMVGSFMQQMGLGNLMGQGVSVDDELHVISSHSLMCETAKEMELNRIHIFKENFFNRWVEFKDYAVDVVDTHNLCDTLRTTLNFKVQIDKDGLADITVKKGFFKIYAKEKNVELPVTLNTIFGEFTVTTTPDYIPGEKYNYTIRVSGYDKAAEDLGKDISISIPNKMANVITMVIETPYISYGKELLNTLGDLYNKRGIDEKNIEATNTARFIEERLAIIREELDSSEMLVEKYKKENNLSDIETEIKAVLENNYQFREQLIETETQLKVIDHIINFISQPENKYELVPFSVGLEGNSALFIESYNKLALNRISLLSSAKEGSPALNLVEKQLDASRENVISSLKTSKSSTEIALAELRKQEDMLMSRISTAPTQEREFISLYRQKVIKEELYIFLLQKQEENALTLAITAPKGQIIDRAFNYNEPSNLSTMMLLIIGFIIGIVIPTVYLYIKYLFRTKFNSREELEQITRVPILGEVCVNYSKDRIVVGEGNTSSIAELFRLMRTNLQFLLTGKNDKVILLTSSVSGEGKSFVSVNLSISLSLLKKRTIIIGLDIRNPQLAEYMNIHPRWGITNYLASEDVNIDDIIVPTGINPQLDLIVAGPIPPNPAELLLNSRMDTLFAELRERYDYIIIDSAPVGMVSDTFSLTRLADTIIYVCRANYTLRDHIHYCNSLVAEGRLPNVSLVVNATTAKQGYGYGYNQNGERVRMHKK